MNRKISGNIYLIVCIDLMLIFLTVIFGIFYRVYGQGIFLTLYVTCLTAAYHFLMRLAVGQAVTAIYRSRQFHVGSRFFHIYKHEPWLYKKIGVKKWKQYAITARPEQFDMHKNSPETLLHNIMQAELGHRIMMLLSFVPLVLIIPYGAAQVFLITSVLSCLIDFKYVIIQRYNRPRVIKLIKNRVLFDK